MFVAAYRFMEKVTVTSPLKELIEAQTSPPLSEKEDLIGSGKLFWVISLMS